MPRRPALLVLVAGALAAPVLAQSLAEVAARDQERRARRPSSPVPSYTDTDLRASPSPSPSPSPSVAPLAWPSARPPGWKAPSPSPTPRPASPRPGVSPAPSPSPSPSPPDRSEQERAALEARWRAIAKQRRDALAAAEARVEELRRQLAAAQNDLSPINLGDPNREQTLRAQRDAARTQLEAAEAEVVRARQAVDDLEDDARRAGALPGWVR